MKLEIEQRTLRDERWFPVFDVLLFFLDEERHSFAAETVEEILRSSWFAQKPKNDQDILRGAAIVKSHERLADRSLVRIDASTPRGGKLDNEPPRIYRRPQLVRSRVYDKQDDEQILP
jgi:hypothetical protein